jgi:hypothetical protein
LSELASSFLAQVTDAEFRSQQLGDLISDQFENFLPWAVGTLIRWINEDRANTSLGLPLFPDDLPSYIRWGVNRPECLQLIAGGLRTRRLVHAIVTAWGEKEIDQPVIQWIKSMTLPDWRSEFAASARELRELLQFSRLPGGGVIGSVLAGQQSDVFLEGAIPFEDRPKVEIRPADEEDPPALGVWRGETLLGLVPTSAHDDIAALLATGLLLELEASFGVDGGQLHISLGDPDSH